MTWTHPQQFNLSSPALLDLALVEYLQELLNLGRGIDDGIRVHVAVSFFNPALGKPSAVMLPRTVKALKGWAAVSPGSSACLCRSKCWAL